MKFDSLSQLIDFKLYTNKKNEQHIPSERNTAKNKLKMYTLHFSSLVKKKWWEVKWEREREKRKVKEEEVEKEKQEKGEE